FMLDYQYYGFYGCSQRKYYDPSVTDGEKYSAYRHSDGANLLFYDCHVFWHKRSYVINNAQDLFYNN
ncbi:MAG: hypothetical protein PHV82_10415, partial [Victivallaceae bacterium]|nr:hypothetical protein [Victivallaceae bacterium]